MHVGRCLIDSGYEPDVVHSANLAIRKKLWAMIDAWMDKAERPFLDNWFARIRRSAVTNWNKEHGLGEDYPDRQAGKKFLFDLSRSRPG